MKRYGVLIIVIICFIVSPLGVNAQTNTYNICKNGCEYKNILDVWKAVNQLNGSHDVVINFKDNGPYSFLDDFDNINLDDFNTGTYEVPLVNTGSSDWYERYYCDNNGERINLNDDRVYDYDTGLMTCLLKDEEEYWETSPFLFNTQLNSITVNGYSNGKTTIDVVGSQEEGSIFKGIERFFFTGFVNAKNATYNNINLIGSFYVGAQDGKISHVVAKNCDFNYGILAYNTDLTITNSSVNRVYSLGSNTKVWLNTNNIFVNDQYEYTMDNNYDLENYDFESEPDADIVTQFENDFFNQIEEAGNGVTSNLTPFVNLVFNNVLNSEKTQLVEIDNGKIVLSEEKKNIVLLVTEKQSLDKVISELKNQEIKEMIIEDESIAVVENGVIIPKGIGTTYINIKTADGSYYGVKVDIKSLDNKSIETILTNPKTGASILLIVFMIIILGTTSYLLVKKKTN